MGVVQNLILGGGASLPTILNVTVSGGTAVSVTATLGSRSVSLAYDSTSDLWSAALPKNATGNWTVTATDGSKTVSDLAAISGPGIWSMGLALGPLPSEFTQIEYIQSSGGAQYINTNWNPASGSGYYIDMMPVERLNNTNNAAFGRMQANGYSVYSALCCFVGNDATVQVWLNNQYDSAAAFVPCTLGQRITLELIGATLTYPGGAHTFSNSFSSSGTAPFFLCRLSLDRTQTTGEQQTGSVRFYRFIGYDSDRNMMRDMYPARCNTSVTAYNGGTQTTATAGTYGMYDLVEMKFYINGGSGSFIAGPDV